MSVEIRFNHIAITSRNPDASVAFYCQHIGFFVAYGGAPPPAVTLRGGAVDLVIAPWVPGDPEPGYNPHGDHLAFYAPVASRDQFIAQLEGNSIEYRQVEDRVYLRDPDGHVVEMSFTL
jgi:catechol 2,3-dioxygenase-like lactoylglutathione lyase family enzyme